MEEVYKEDSGSCNAESFTVEEEENEGGEGDDDGEGGEGLASTEESTIMELRIRELLGGVGRERNTDSVYCVYCLGLSLSTVVSL